MSSVLVLSHAEVLVALPPDECADAMAEVLVAHARGEAQMPLRSMVPFQGAEGFMGLMPAWRGGSQPVFALKLLDNPRAAADGVAWIVIPAANATIVTSTRTRRSIANIHSRYAGHPKISTVRS